MPPLPLRRAELVCALPAALALACAAAPAAAQNLVPIESGQLTQLDAWTVSALGRAQGALPDTLWAQSDPAVLALLLDRLPASYESPAVQGLARRVLLSGGDAPRGDSSAAARKRFEALGKMGAADSLATMATGAGTGLADPMIAQFAAQAELARGRRAEACARGRAAETAGPVPFLLRLRAYCAAAGGDRAAADLALELARGAGPDDPWYAQATAAAGGAPGARPPAARYDNSLNVQLSLAAALRPGPNPLANSSGLALVALARAEASPQPIRAQAAALAFRRGLLTPDEARAILLATPADISVGLPPIAVALRQIEAAKAPAAAAPAPAALTPPPSPDMAIAAAIAGVLRQSTAPADFAAAARLFARDIANLSTAPDAAAAVAFARAALYAGDIGTAARLTDIVAQSGIDAAAIAPLQAALAAARGPRIAGADLVVARRIDAAGAALARPAARDAAILAALGFALDGAGQAFLIANPPQGGARADAGIMTALAPALERRAVGDVALLSALAAAPGPAALDTPSLVAVIAALREIGLDEDARRIGVEALLAGQPA